MRREQLVEPDRTLEEDLLRLAEQWRREIDRIDRIARPMDPRRREYALYRGREHEAIRTRDELVALMRRHGMQPG